MYFNYFIVRNVALAVFQANFTDGCVDSPKHALTL